MASARDIYCTEPWFSYIREGRKDVEGRKNSPAWRDVRAGDTLRFRNGQASFLAEVVAVRLYGPGPDSLRQYITTETLERVLPGIATPEEGCAVYLQWSTPEEIARHGMIAIQVRVLPSE